MHPEIASISETAKEDPRLTSEICVTAEESKARRFAYIVVTGSGHWLMEEAPDKVIPVLVTFVNKE
jgi:hypothetical protein